MTKAQKASSQDPKITPIFYADQPASVVYGPHVTKITFGVAEDDGSEYPRPIVTIAMPTVSLLRFIKDLAQNLSTDEYKSEMLAGLKEAMDTLVAMDSVASE